MTRTPKSTADDFNEIATIRIELRWTDPVIWREVEVPTSLTLKRLHDVIQVVMGWCDYHLWEFTVAKRRYGLSMDEDWGTEPRFEAAKTRLRDVLSPRKTSMDYIYDFGDSWEHKLTVTNIRQGDPGLSYPRLTGGEYSAPPEDCGGVPGYYDILDVLADPNHPDHAERQKEYEGFDPDAFDETPVKFALGRIANQRKGAKARITKKATSEPS